MFFLIKKFSARILTDLQLLRSIVQNFLNSGLNFRFLSPVSRLICVYCFVSGCHHLRINRKSVSYVGNSLSGASMKPIFHGVVNQRLTGILSAFTDNYFFLFFYRLSTKSLFNLHVRPLPSQSLTPHLKHG